jgi:uncharacterized membrane protein YkvA (DUF1232 family)
MRNFSSFPSKQPLPWPPAHAHSRRQRVGDWPLDDAQVVQFDALLHDIYPDAPRVDADRLAQLSRWLMAMPEDEARSVLDERLVRIEQLRSMVADPDWDCAEADRLRVQKLLGYLDQVDNLIPDRIPLLGKLDDIVLMELAWPALANEVDEYDDFSQYRASESPSGDGRERRATWIRERLAALALLQHQQRINESRYAEGGRPVLPFRVGG